MEAAGVEDVARVEAVFYLFIQAFDRFVGERIDTGILFHGRGGAIDGRGAAGSINLPAYGVYFIFHSSLTDAHPYPAPCSIQVPGAAAQFIDETGQIPGRRRGE